MNMSFGLFQEQTLKLVMTPELRQAITILQYSALDLRSYLQDQAAENPVIELQEISAAVETPMEQKPTPEIDWKELISNRATGDYSLARSESTYNPLDHVHAPSSNLYQHLKEQLGYTKGLTRGQRKIALFLIGNLDEKGYLEIETEEASRQLGVDLEEVEDMLSLIQHFDPVGVAARNLQECLLLQLQHTGLDDEKTVQVIEQHLDDLAQNRFSRIAEKLKIDLQEVQTIADLVRSLNPRPGAAFNQTETRFVMPDVTVEKVEGEYVVLVNESSTPRLTISRFYESMLKQTNSESEARQFIQDKMNAAMWLAKSIEQRRLTLLRVMQAIVEKQIDFFEHGVDRLKPMTQKEIAERVGLHESTVSRATSNKYVQTPRGVFELKYFFTSALSTANGDAASSESVKRRIKALVDAEDRSRPLSDQKLTELLAKEGIEISRRTVAKYREELMIPSSAKRKRYA
ncbi:RNA polymerase factor sigma-54 [Brevibacillus humidisoli]|uniref:RNA polymerase factor sigma-54 n=1 Tax=Brevibacillus humidisoli TaxID=2895522 RepID=UPI001E3A6C9A|nr:RNA polymerase factor sigma-54 [Brevibacillus humidisoli]UFJ39959.1 RNA polymerase factor sigma-54 [Brevibacillus humidisoli]